MKCTNCGILEAVEGEAMCAECRHFQLEPERVQEGRAVGVVGFVVEDHVVARRRQERGTQQGFVFWGVNA